MDKKEREKYQDLADRITNIGDIAGLITIVVGGPYTIYRSFPTNQEVQNFYSDAYVQLSPYLDFLI